MESFNFNVQIQEVEQISPLLSRCKVYICYSDLNRNNSIISRELINSKLYTLKNCPIVGQYSESKDDFTDHGGKLEQDKDGNYQYVITTIPYGLIPESSEIKWEFVDGKDYLTCTGFLWTSRYPQGAKAIEEGRPQSMEIQEVSGEFNNKKQFIVSDFCFSALTILGNDVEPCFEGAKIVGYSKDSIENEVNKMAEELKQLSPTLHSYNTKTKEVDAVKKKTDIAAQFSLTVNQLMEEMSRALCEIKYSTTDWYGDEYECSRFYLRDFDEQYAYAVDRQNDYIDVKIPYAMSGDNVSFDVDGVKRIKYVPTDWEGTMDSEDDDDMMEGNFALQLVKEFKEEFGKLATTNSSLEQKLSEKDNAILSLNDKFTVIQDEMAEKVEELETLKEFKLQYEKNVRSEKIENLFSQVAKHLTKEEIEQFRAKEQQYESVESFEKELKSFVCDKLVFDANSKPHTYSRIGIPPQAQQTNTNEDSNIFDRWKSQSK